MDVTGADLSGDTDLDLISLTNVIWSADTVWPPALRSAVMTGSRAGCRDLFQFMPG